MDHELFMHLCGLASLRLDETEVQEFEAKFKRMLEMVDSLAAWEAQDSAADSRLTHGLTLRTDIPVDYVWPQGTVHDYRVPMIIDFEGDS